MERNRLILVGVTASLLGAFILWPTGPGPRKTASSRGRGPARAKTVAAPIEETDEPAPIQARLTAEPRACGDDPDPDAPAVAKTPTEPKRGTPAEWRASYQGISGFDKHDPPALLPIAGAGGIAKTTVALVRESALVLLELPKGEERVYDVRGGKYAAPRWSADGRWLFFLSDRQDRPLFGDRAPTRITRMRPDGSERRVISGPLCAPSPEWAVSPDGGQVAYVVPTFVGPSYQETTSLRLVEVAGDLDRVIDEGLDLKAPAFSQDGRTLLYARDAQTEEGIPATAITSFTLADRQRKTHLQEGLAFLADLRTLRDGRVFFVGDTNESGCCREPHLFSFDPQSGQRAPFGTAEAPEGYLHLVPAPSGSVFLSAYSRRANGGGMADWHADVVLLDGAGKLTKGQAFAAAFPRPFFGAGDPSFSVDERHAFLQLTLHPWREDDFEERTIVLADLRNPGPLYRVASGETPAVRPRVSD